jgi:hypothetical protein
MVDAGHVSVTASDTPVRPREYMYPRAMSFALDSLGWIGAAALVAAYWLVSTRKTSGDSTRYQMLNLIGSVLVLVNSLYYGAYPSVAVNGLWVAIGVYSLSGRAARL